MKRDTINHAQLLELVKQSKGMLILGIESVTDTRCRKTGNPFGQVFKRVYAVSFCGANYETAVNNEALRQGCEPVFESQPLPWGEYLIQNKVITHKGKLYLACQWTPGKRLAQPAIVKGYATEDGTPVSYSDIAAFLPAKREVKTQQEQTGIEETVWFRAYSFDSIRKIRIGGRAYNVIP